MSKEKKQRGRRIKQKEDTSLGNNEDFISLSGGFDDEEQPTAVSNTPFFGLVDSTELEYFKSAESTLSADSFENEEEKLQFITGVYEEAKGKELKLVTNQICSKLVERLILHGSYVQIKQLYTAFSGHFVPLSHQKYSSHCIETLLVRSASLVEKEITLELKHDDEDESGSFATIENLFLYMVNEIKPNVKEMISHQYATHVLRLILLILSGNVLPSGTKSNSTLRSKRSKIARKMIELKDTEDFQRSFQIPKETFKEELKDIVNAISRNETTKSMREFAIQAIASPVIQLVTQVEGLVDGDRKVWHMLFQPVDSPKSDDESAFVEYLLSDPIGSHFLEAAAKQQRLKYLERLYTLYMKDRIFKLAKREKTGVYVVKALLMRLKPREQKEILDSLIPHLNELIEESYDLGETIIDASSSRKDYKKDEIVANITDFFKTKSESSTDQDLLESCLHLSTSTLGNTKDDWPTAEERRRSLFLQKLINYHAEFAQLTADSLVKLPHERFIQMCQHGVFSHVVESVLDADLIPDVIKRKIILNECFMKNDDAILLSCNAYGSHLMDKLWDFTVKLNVYKDRIAESLFKNQEKVKESNYGKMVWKNWSMELYSRKRGDWKRLVREQTLAKYPPPSVEDDSESKKRKLDEQQQQRKRGRR
ncbi:unnamed protein product [Kuraishia capsulata CBS 1993]|uniref:Nucleolar protein 9 n=1 Tax=Kuraishia capsulata CBS 1993 TaxID=1382522 RepID=W6MT87_9ASCO|nr:uncharacterized protein KUCA_T00006026001 [Kuraishia capsulata CBS 1993]CDK30031.1 unnamed protein product [Kuraishia capsulata CBS 1993]